MKQTTRWRMASAVACLAAGLGAALGAAAAAEAPAGKTKVFIFAGQSNIVGKADREKLPAEYREPLPNVRLYSNQNWRDLAGPVKGRRSEDGIGPEVSAARLIAGVLPGAKIIVVKSAVGGTNLHTQWNPTNKSGLYAQMLADVKAATADQEFEIVALFWGQGAADAKDEVNAKAYGKNLAAFIAAVRKDLGRPELPVIFSQQMGELADNLQEKYPFWGEVCKGKEEVAKNDPRTAIISTDGLKLLPDGLHYDTAGTIEFGRRLFEAWEKKFHNQPQKP